LAEGMKRREANDRGIPFESGGLENGLLNGLSRSASNLASSSSREYGQARPKVNVEAGVSFLLFLNRRYEP